MYLDERQELVNFATGVVLTVVVEKVRNDGRVVLDVPAHQHRDRLAATPAGDAARPRQVPDDVIIRVTVARRVLERRQLDQPISQYSLIGNESVGRKLQLTHTRLTALFPGLPG